MIVLGIESSCDECSSALVENGKHILSNVVATQIPFHEPWGGVVPEIASRKHAEWISSVVSESFRQAGLSFSNIHGVAVTSRPGLMGALLVGLNFAKAFAYARRLPFIACDHILAHIYAARLSGSTPPYPFLALLVSGGHTLICKMDDFDTITVLGSTVDDSAGEAFDKVSKHFGWGYPGGKYIDALSRQGDPNAFAFPVSVLHKKGYCDVSYSGLKTAVIHQRDLFKKKDAPSDADIAASFQKAAIETIVRAVRAAAEQSEMTSITAAGGVAANSCLRDALAKESRLRCTFPSVELCGDNGAMIAGLGYEYLTRGVTSPLNIGANARVPAFKRAG
ncbi:MAG: tRNA (adenosine(37)-N6)-threonylcarbamoyltransferase complex transferase subunit TsaD [Spirochaetaceae bacterium]|jgi:N6-L-threonylcarbamoyladenine synthase|nr:tRNA (adenosine(37)-N6)-threonylcarbamoyltransferase complex transferase subunit TsaD [Spirochaetaceae bacterium]